MAISMLLKEQLAGKLAKKTSTLDEKIKFLDFAKKNPKLGCGKQADVYKIRKTAAANILKNEKKIREHEMFCEKSKKRTCHGKYHKINKILLHVVLLTSTQMLNEEAMVIKEKLQNNDFPDFSASDGWLDCWKGTYPVKQRHIVGKAGDVSTELVTSRMERINKLIEGYSLENKWNVDESDCF